MDRKKPTWGVSPAAIKALDYIGSHRRTDVKPKLKSCPVSMRTANLLVGWRWCMWMSDGETIMLTAEGQRRWSLRHPYSKYRLS